MARKVLTVVISADGRDKGKHFLIREMPVRQSEYWGMRVLSAMALSGVEVPDDIATSGLAGVAAFGIRAVMGSFGKPEMRELLDEMLFSCVSVIPDPAKPHIVRGAGALPEIRPVGALQEDDIEELATMAQLRREVLLMHLDFLPPAVRSPLEHILGASGSSQNT